ncbi:MAG TPA: DUF1080 domain-containing protein [Fimbriimonadaceae bacterium]|nr:DUF1080 domain-containing protein [Fimbriimonadaceae bacterium]
MLATALVLLALQQPGPLIFDGKTLDGWTPIGGGTWVAKDGMIVGTSAPGQPQGLLLWKDPVKDFHATLKFRINAGDSGFYFRVALTDKDPFCEGFQVEIDTTPETGGIYETAGRGWVNLPDPALHHKSGYKAGQWTDLDVTAVGTHYKVLVNGTLITDIDDAKGRTEGRLALQLHGNMDMDVSFKDVRLQEIQTN